MARPEFPIIVAGAVAIGAGMAREGGWPKRGAESAMGTVVLALAASLADRTKLAPIVTPLAWLILVAILIRSVPAFQTKAKAKAKK
jgi:hypothetical protein